MKVRNPIQESAGFDNDDDVWTMPPRPENTF